MRLLVLLLSLFLAGAAVAQTDSQQVPAAAPEQNVKDQQQRPATQPGNNAPFYREVRSGQSQYTTSSARGRETDVLVQSWGDTWRRIRNGPVMFYGGWLVVLILAAIAAFYAVFGAVKVHERPTGRVIRRFSPTEQIVHWTVAISFCTLGLSGLIMFFGKHVLLPIIGYTLFAWLTALSKNLHNFVAPVFIVSVLALIVLFLKDNLFKSYDWKFLANAFAVMAKGKHVPTGRFNGGEKVWFWLGVVILSVMVTWSGLILLFPNFDQTRAVMQEAWIWHASAALLYVSIALGHIYLGTIGLEGSYRAMRDGYVDEAWAKEHHEIWYEEVKSGRRPGAQTSAGGSVPAGAAHMEEKS
jgi:formate dehydrogenase subunit gamma